MKSIFGGILLLVSVSVNASLIESVNYSNDVDNSYWTNLDLNLDILRLDWVDTLGSSNQADLPDYQAFVDDANGTWRFASWNEFLDIINWFDTDPTQNDWSLAQNLGGNLFFELNGFGPAFNEQYGFDHEGYTYWQVGSLNLENVLEYVWFADFGDQDSRVVCVEWSVLCKHSYFPNPERTPMFTADSILSMGDINVAPLLVRDVNNVTTQQEPTSVSEPSIIWLFLSGVVLLGVQRFKHNFS